MIRGRVPIAFSGGKTTDMLARYGVEEFLLILSQTRGREAVAVCERIREAIAKMRLPHPS